VHCHFGFDMAGLRAARSRGDVLVVVDVLSFSTTVATGTARGVRFHPAGSHRRAEAVSRATGAVLSVSRREPPRAGAYSLSPLSYRDAPAGLEVALRSPNGARMAVLSRGKVAALVVGALVNASAAGAAAAAGARAAGVGVTVLACGERTPGGGRRRFAAEDFLGAGAVIAAVDLPRTGDAEAPVRAFEASREDLEGFLLETESGRELAAAGYREDVVHAARLDSLASVPLLLDGVLRGR